MKGFLKDNSLSLVFGALFLGTLVGQAFVGHSDFNEDAVAHHEGTVSLWRYVTSSSFGADVMENWQSEYLQFTLFILGTIWLLQRGSPESKVMHEAGTESDEDQGVGRHADDRSPRWARFGDWRTTLYSYSLLLVMGGIWIGTWIAQTVTGRVAFNAEQLTHHRDAVSLLEYVGTSDFWNRTLQNWQSEFLAVGWMAILSVYLRARGSAESKPVGAPHDATGVEG
jgi:uncharacterized protein DUF6766